MCTIRRVALLALLAAAPACSNPPPAPADADGDLEPDAAADADLESDADADADADEAPPPCATGWAETFETPQEARIGEGFTGTFPECASAARFAVVPAGMVVDVELSGLPAGTLVTAVELDGSLLAAQYVVEGSAAVSFSPARSGEVRLLLRRPDGRATPAYAGRLECAERCELEATRYPIVLVHGMAGTDSYFGLFDYFFEIVPLLTDAGYLVYTPVTPAIGDSEVDRAPALAAQVDEILADTGATKLHLIGHSQGGLDVRVMLGGLGYEPVAASVTTIATPHRGIRVDVPAWLAGMDFSEEHLTGEFAELYPDPTAIPLFSWAGRTCGALEFECQEELDGEIVGALFAAWHPLIEEAHGDDAYAGANDGLVPVASAEWGELLGVLPADHIDEIGQVAGATQGPFDHRAFFLAEARRLRALELERGL